MKTIPTLFLAGIVAALSGCSTPTVVPTRVGPAPFATKNGDVDGNLKVFTQVEEQNDVGFQFPYSERTGYDVLDASGKRVERIYGNNNGNFADAPRAIRLAPGMYQVKAMAAEGLGQLLLVPVIIEAGRTTEVHLSGHWRPPVNTPENELVRAPAGFPMGWRADAHPTS